MEVARTFGPKQSKEVTASADQPQVNSGNSYLDQIQTGPSPIHLHEFLEAFMADPGIRRRGSQYRAATQGYADSQYHVAYSFLKGRGVDNNEAEAVKWL